MQEKPVRSIVKALSWRITATIIILIASYFITGKIDTALSIGAVDFFAKLIIYYLHERAWNKIPFGLAKKKEPEYYI